jgi:hypothetical protein
MNRSPVQSTGSSVAQKFPWRIVERNVGERSTNPILNASPVCPTVESCACVDLRFGQSGGS